ncbi:electron transport complex subunit RsxG [Marinobacter caseinilyticus]|uniref:electron transport complex subunit RsxG n=1 Tax=Marinobacter caseinilyticus TaxID=2692195 RepID=UPI001408FD63|nr:electron transport complex subunit RsxG [Marinobacter caseinilyticus]
MAIKRSIIRNALGLGLFAIITAGIIAVTQAVTAERIAEQTRKAEAAALFDIIPERQHDNDLLSDTVTLPPSPLLGTGDIGHGWVARQNDQPVGVILPVMAPDGYSGNIRLLVGIGHDTQVLGVRVTSHRETPGLGDKIELRKSSWVRTFDGRSLGDPAPEQWTVAKNGGAFDQFTGATITPRAVVKAVKKALIYFDNHQGTLLSDTSNQ